MSRRIRARVPRTVAPKVISEVPVLGQRAAAYYGTSDGARVKAYPKQASKPWCLKCNSITCKHAKVVAQHMARPDYRVPDWLKEQAREEQRFLEELRP